MRRKTTTESAQTGATAVAAAAAPHAAQSPITSTAGTREGNPTAPAGASPHRGYALACAILGTLPPHGAAFVAFVVRTFLASALSACGARAHDETAASVELDAALESSCHLGPGGVEAYPHADAICAALTGESTGGLARMIRESAHIATVAAEEIPGAVAALDAYLLTVGGGAR